jgi:hypothetical protein
MLVTQSPHRGLEDKIAMIVDVANGIVDAILVVTHTIYLAHFILATSSTVALKEIKQVIYQLHKVWMALFMILLTFWMLGQTAHLAR